MKIQIMEGDGEVVKDTQYKKMMKHLQQITRKGGELDPAALAALKKMETEARESKGKKKSAPDATDDSSSNKRARTAAATAATAASAAPKKQANKGGGGGDDEFEIAAGDDEENDDDDDEDENKIMPSYISEAIGDDAEPSNITKPDEPIVNPEEDKEYIVKIEEILLRESENGLRPSVPTMFVQNMVATAQTNMFVNIKLLLPHLQRFGVYQNTKRFIAMTQRTRDPRSSTLSFRNGKFVNTGSRTEQDARMSIQSLIDMIASVEFQTSPGVYVRPYADMKIQQCTVHNIVGSTTVPFEIDLSFLAQYEFVYYFKMLFVGAIVSVYGISNQEIDRKVKILVFATGNIVCTGAKTVEHIKLVFELLYPYLSRAALQSTLPPEMRTTKSRKRRLDQDKRKVKALPQGSTSIIKLDADLMIDEYRAINANRETAQQAMDREREQQAGTLAGLSTQSMNVVAMNSMIVEQHRQDAQIEEKARTLLLTNGSTNMHKERTGRIQVMDKITANILAQNH